MKAREFRDVAEYLSTLSSVSFLEGKERTAISRFYYYVFLRIRNEIIFQFDSRKEIREALSSSSAHGLVRRYIREVAKVSKQLSGMYQTHLREIFEIAALMDQLHHKRKIADYDIDIRVDLEDVNSAANLVGEIEQKLIILENVLRALSSLKMLPKLNTPKRRDN